MRNQIKETRQQAHRRPAKGHVPFDFGTDVPPIDTPEFRRRLGQVIANATQPDWMRDEPRRSPKRH